MSSVERYRLAENPTFIGKLCESKVSRRILRHFLSLGVVDGDVKQRVIDIVEHEDVDTSRTTFNKHAHVFVKMGVIEQVGEGRYVRYKPAVDSPSFNELVRVDDLLRSYSRRNVGGEVGAALTDLYGGESLGILTDYFIRLGVEEDDHELMSKNQIHKQTGVARKTIIDNIDILVEYGILYEDEQFSYSRYKPNPDTDPFKGIVEANVALVEAFDN